MPHPITASVLWNLRSSGMRAANDGMQRDWTGWPTGGQVQTAPEKVRRQYVRFTPEQETELFEFCAAFEAQGISCSRKILEQLASLVRLFTISTHLPPWH